MSWTPRPPDTPPVLPTPVRRTFPQLPTAAVLALIGLGLGVTYLHHFRLGCSIVGCGLLLAAGLRLRLSAHRAGLLVVRSRALDVAILTSLGVTVLVLTAVVPPLRT